MASRMSTYTEYDMDCLEELQWVVSKAIDPSVARRLKMVALVWALFAFVASAVVFSKNGHPAVVALLFVVGLLFAARASHVYRSMAKKSWMDMDKSIVRSDYALDKSHLIVSNAKGSTRYPYSQCFRLLETEERIYVIMKDRQGIVLDKSNLSGGSPEELRSWLEAKCGKKAERLSRGWSLPKPRITLPGGPRRLQ